MLISLETSIIFLVIGTILYVIGKYVPIEATINRILWIIGLVFLIIGVVLIVAWAIMFII
jgi:hypothetical protein